jgi:hypothetical protein
MTTYAMGLLLGFAVVLLAAELIFVYLTYPWDLLGLVAVGGALGYLIPALYNEQTRR